MQTCPHNEYPHCTPLSCGESVVYRIFLQNIDCGYSLEPPHHGGSNEYPQSMFLRKNIMNIKFFQLIFISFYSSNLYFVWVCFPYCFSRCLLPASTVRTAHGMGPPRAHTPPPTVKKELINHSKVRGIDIIRDPKLNKVRNQPCKNWTLYFCKLFLSEKFKMHVMSDTVSGM